MVAAIGSFLDARACGGRWLLRIEDVDAPRCNARAERDIVATLERFGLEWDGPVVCQRDRIEHYQLALDHLRETGAVFGCACTRREIADSSLARDGSRIYPGTCRHGLPTGRSARAWRVRAAGNVDFIDRIQGVQQEQLECEVGDFILLRADGLFAYQLAVVVDDAIDGITHVVRGADLLDSTARQIHLQRLLGYATPEYAHLPVAVNRAGEKLSKQTLAPAIGDDAVERTWLATLGFLGQNPPYGLGEACLDEIRAWAVTNWSPEKVPAQRFETAPQAYLAPIEPTER
jgi:glutamyl-Q tRNA(Asp) synthetase